MGFLQKIPLKKSFKTIFDFYIHHRNMGKSPNVLKKFSTFFIKSCRNRAMFILDIPCSKNSKIISKNLQIYFGMMNFTFEFWLALLRPRIACGFRESAVTFYRRNLATGQQECILTVYVVST